MMSNNFDNGLFKCLDLIQKLENQTLNRKEKKIA